jgi:hypothetical protein
MALRVGVVIVAVMMLVSFGSGMKDLLAKLNDVNLIRVLF